MKKFNLAHVPFFLLGLLAVTVATSSNSFVDVAHAQEQQVVTPYYNCLGPCPTATPTKSPYYTIPTATPAPYYQQPTAAPYNPYATPTTQPCYNVAPAQSKSQSYGYGSSYSAPKYTSYAAPKYTYTYKQPTYYAQPTKAPYYQQPTQAPYYQQPTQAPYYQQPTQAPYYQQPTQAPYYQQPTKAPYYGYVAPTKAPYYQQPTQAPYYQQPTKAPYYGYVAPTKAPYYGYVAPTPVYRQTYQPTYQYKVPVYSYNTYTQNPQPRSYGGFLSFLSIFSNKNYGIGSNPNPGYQSPPPYYPAQGQNYGYAVPTPVPYYAYPTPTAAYQPAYQATAPYNPYYNPCPPPTTQPYYGYATPTPQPYYVVTPTPEPYYQVATPTPAPYYIVVTPTPEPYYQVGSPYPQPSVTPCYDDSLYENANGTAPAQTSPDERRGWKRFRSHHGWNGFMGQLFRMLSSIMGNKDPYNDTPPCSPPTGPVTGTTAPEPEPSVAVESVSPSPEPSGTDEPCTLPGLGDLTSNVTTQDDAQVASGSGADAISGTPTDITGSSSDRSGFLKDFFQFFYFFINLILKIVNGSSPC